MCYCAALVGVLSLYGQEASAEIHVLTEEELAALGEGSFEDAGTESAASDSDRSSPAEPESTDEGAPTVDATPIITSDEYEVVVRARRLERAASDFSIEVAERPVASRGQMSSVLRLVPGLHLSQHSGEGKADQFFLRGFDAIHGQDIEVIVGGIPINEPSNVHGQGYADLNFVIPELIASLRAIEGTYDLRQGDFAVAGSLRLDLGLAERGVTIRGDYGNFDSWRTFVAWGPRSQPEETFVAVDYEASDGFGPNRAWNRVRAMGQALLELPGDWSMRLLATSHAGRFSSAGVVRIDDLETGEFGFYDTYDPFQGGFSSRHQGLAEVRYEGDDDRASLSLFGGYRDLRLCHDFTGFIQETAAQSGEITSRPGDLAEQVHEALDLGMTGAYRRLSIPLPWVRSIEVGLSVRHTRIDQSQRRLRRVDRQPWRDEIDAALQLTSIGSYLDLDIQPTTWLALRGGLRMDAFAAEIVDHLGYEGLGGRRDALGVQASPRATIEARPAESVSIFASYGRGLRSPQALSLGDGEKVPLTTIDSGELGFSLRREDLGELRLAGFTTYIEEDLIFDHVTGRNVFTGETLRSGVTLAVARELTSWARAAGNLTWTRATLLETGELVPYAPPLVARADLIAGGVVARFWQRELRLEGTVSVSVVGPRPLPYDERSHSMVLVDVAGSIRLGEIELGVSLRNLMNRRWRDGEFVYVSNFERDRTDPSLVPARHLTAGYPLLVMGFVALHL